MRRAGVLPALAAFSPRVAGTPPLGLDMPASDIDVLCHAPDADAFAAVVQSAFGDAADFFLRRWQDADGTVVAGFTAHGWAFEIFGQARPVEEQAGWRHFEVERRLLALGGAGLRAAVLQARREGLKTEPAFAAVLGLPGNPYAALLALAGQTDAGLAGLLEAAGWGGPSMRS